MEHKSFRVLQALLTGKSFNRFEAEDELHDHCLPSTISHIQARYKVVVCRVFEVVASYYGNEIQCCRYWIDSEEISRYKKEDTIIKKLSAVTASMEEL